jgi:hypothetical protein
VELHQVGCVANDEPGLAPAGLAREALDDAAADAARAADDERDLTGEPYRRPLRDSTSSDERLARSVCFQAACGDTLTKLNSVLYSTKGEGDA